MANNKSSERELAAQLYMYTNMSQKEIAERIGVTEKTIGQWKDLEKWDDMKNAFLSTDRQTIVDLQILLRKQAEKNVEKQKDGSFKKEDADTMLELARTIDTLQGGIPLRMIVQVMDEFISSIPAKDQKLRKQVANLQMVYLLNKAKSLES